MSDKDTRKVRDMLKLSTSIKENFTKVVCTFTNDNLYTLARDYNITVRSLAMELLKLRKRQEDPSSVDK
jgi:hypothetical protein